jgi:transcription antitermination factor NusG
MSNLNNVSNDIIQERAWFALYTKPRSEFKAAEQIEEVNVPFYLPTITRIKQWSDRKKKITEPLLRGYIFIFASEKERVLALERHSVVKCIFDQGRPAKIPEWQIENLKKMLESKADLTIREGLPVGTRVLIKDGPFADVIGVVSETDNGKTIAVSIDLLNRSVIAHLPKDSLFEVVGK